MATYASFSELKDKQLEFGDEVQFTIKEDKLFYTVDNSFLADSAHTSNAIIFEKLNISDKNKYASLIYGYTVVSGKGEYSWPEFRENDYKAATKLVCNLFKKCEDVVKGSLYKVGDKVVVKNKLDLESSVYDYPCGFTDIMYKNYGGKKVTITKVRPLPQVHTKCKFYIEDYEYLIKEDNNLYNWSAAMFVGKIEEKPKVLKILDFLLLKKIFLKIALIIHT